MSNFAKEIIPVNLEDEMKQSYLDYAMSVIVGRALPDARDGLKPVHRRVLYAMSELGNDWNKPYKKSARIVGDCFVKGVLVHTEQGLQTIETLAIGQNVLLPNGSLSAITQTFCNPPSGVIDIKLSNGYTFTVTKGQLFRVLNDDLSIGWEKAEDLQDKLVLATNARSFGETLTTDDDDKIALAYSVGLLVAEGYLTDRSRSKQVGVSMVDKGPLEYLSDYCISKGIKANWTSRPPQKPHHQAQHCVRFTGLDEAYQACEDTCAHKRVPVWILGNRDYYAPFLAGFIDGDGFIRKAAREVIFTSTSGQLLAEMQAMLADSGIHCCLSNEDFSAKNYGDGCLTRYNLSVTGENATRFCALIKDYLKIPYKKSRAIEVAKWSDRTLHTQPEFIPSLAIFTELSKHHLGGGWYQDSNGQKFRAGIKYPTGAKIRYSGDLIEKDISYRQLEEWGILEKLARLDSPLADKLKTLINTYSVLRVEQVVDNNDLQETYDIQIADDAHEFLVQGCAVHNCIGKYHPHGDTAVYDTMVRMAQPFSMRYMLIDGQGNFGCFTGNTKIKLLDGTEKSFVELAELPAEEVFHVYSTDKDGKIVVGEGRHSRITRKNAELVELTLDSGGKIRCTPDHRFLLRDGTYKQAQYLTVDDSLMAGYFDTAPIKEGLNDYLRIYQPTTQQYEFVHCLADKLNEAKGLTPAKNGAFVRHHKNFNRWDNRPTNIERLSFLAHLHLHAEHLAVLWQDDSFRQQQRQGVKDYYANNPDVIEARRTRFVQQNKNEVFRRENGRRVAKALKQRHADNPALKEEIALRMKALWQDADYRQKMQLALADIEKRPLSPEEKLRVAQIVSEKSRALWQDDDKRAEISAAIAKALASPEVRQKISENSRRLWRDPNYRAHYGDDHFTKMAKIYWEKPNSRAFHREKITKQRLSDAFCAAQRGGLQKSNARRLQNNPQMMQQMTAQAIVALKVKWQNSDYKEQVIKQKIARYGSQLVTEFGVEQLTPELYENQRRANWIPRLTTALSYFQGFSELKHAAQNYNHRVIAINWLRETADVYDITVDEHHNFLLADGVFVHNSVDGDPPAAMRYTEVRMAKIAHELLADLDKETVDFIPNYDESEIQPEVLPTRVPNLLVNGSSGIAVGMATNIPPHNLSEVVSACLAMIDNPDITVYELMAHIPGPDFPTAASINGASGIYNAYTTGRGKIYLRARCHFEDIGDSSRQAIITTELPYQVNKARLLEKIAELVKEGKLEGISGLRDESDKDGMRMVIELRRNEVPEVVLNNLYKQTQFQTVFGINMVALLDGRPHCMNLSEILSAFIDHRRVCVTRRTLYNLRRARERAHILEGLAVALANIDEMIALIKAASNPAEAKEDLLARTWDAGLVSALLDRADATRSRPEDLGIEFGILESVYRLSETQAQAILDLRLHRLTGLEQDKIVNEYKQLLEQIDGYLAILGSDTRLMEVVREELVAIKDQYSDPRRTEIVQNQLDLSEQDLITEEDMVVTLSHEGYVKSQPLDDYKAQRRGGRGKSATATKELDYIDKLIVANTHDIILCFSSLGKVYWLKVYQLPVASRAARGKPFVNLLPLEQGEKINAILPIREYSEDKFIFMATASGTVKKTPLSSFKNPRSIGIIAINLREDDTLVGVAVTDGQQNVLLFSSTGKAICFNETDVNSVGRTAAGVRGMRLKEGQKIISLIIASEGTVLNITENGYGKRTKLEEFTCHKRGGQGMIAIQTSARNGDVVGAVLVNDNDEIMLITDGGTLVRTRVDGISVVGRNTQGVTIIRLDKKEKVIGVDRIAGLAGVDDQEDAEGLDVEGVDDGNEIPAIEPSDDQGIEE